MRFATLFATATVVAGQASPEVRRVIVYACDARCPPVRRPDLTYGWALCMCVFVGLQACASDVDGDGLVNVNDLLSMLSQFGAAGSMPEDVNADNVVNVRRIF